MRLTLSDARTTIGRVLGICPTDSRVADYLNEATRRLLYEGKWVGTYAKYQICTTGNESDSIITWPRQLETIETVAICDRPGIVRNGWFEYLESGPGLLTSDNNIGFALVDRGEAYTTSDIVTTGNPKKIKVISDKAEAASLTVLIQGTDVNGEPIITNPSGTWINGELVTIAIGGNLTTNNFYSITGIQKSATAGPVRLYEYDTVTTATRQIAFYASDETNPVYRRSIIPGLQNFGTCEDCTGTNQSVQVIGKLRYIPVVNDTDWLLIGNLPALKLAVMAIKKEEADLIEEANIYMYGGLLPSGVNVIGAVPLLQKELNHWLGDGVAVTMKVQDRETFGAGAVENVI